MGVVALVLILISVFVAFRSTRGVPLIPRYNLTVQFPTTGKLTAGSDVMVSGRRIGLVTDVKAVALEDDQEAAEMTLALENDFGPLPVDSTFSVRLLGALGKKFVDIRPGTSNRTLPDGSFVSLADNPDSDPVTDIDEVLNTFTEPARAGTRTTFEALGVGFAGRGADLNGFLEHFPDTLKESDRAMRILNAPSTNLAGFVQGLHRFAAELAPVSPVIPGLVTDLDSTFRAFNDSREQLGEAIAKSPDLLGTLTETLPRERRVIAASAKLMHELAPGTAFLPETAPVLADALEAGSSNLPLVPRLSERAASLTRNLADYAQVPIVIEGQLRLADTFNALEPLIAFLTPAETTCNYYSLLFRNLASLSREPVGTGTPFRVTAVVTDTTRNSERGPSAGIWQASAGKAIGPVHTNPYPNFGGPGQTYECEGGNEPYVQNRPLIGNVPGQQKTVTEDPAVAP